MFNIPRLSEPSSSGCSDYPNRFLAEENNSFLLLSNKYGIN